MTKILLMFSLIVTLSQACTQTEYDTARSYIVSAVRSGDFGGGQKAATLLRLSKLEYIDLMDFLSVVLPFRFSRLRELL